MSARPKSLKSGASPRATRRELEQVRTAANTFIVKSYPFGLLGGVPRRLILESRELWVIPILFTSPGAGPVGEVGMVAVDGRSMTVVGSSPRTEVVAASNGLREANADELEAAFHRARTI